MPVSRVPDEKKLIPHPVAGDFAEELGVCDDCGQDDCVPCTFHPAENNRTCSGLCACPEHEGYEDDGKWVGYKKAYCDRCGFHAGECTINELDCPQCECSNCGSHDCVDCPDDICSGTCACDAHALFWKCPQWIADV